jgi:hypothetical protein
MIGGPAQRRRRHLAKQLSVCRCEASEFQKPVVGGYLGHRFHRRISSRECLPHMVHSAHPKIPAGTHSQMLLAVLSECPIRYADHRAHVRNTERPVQVFLHDTLKTPHHSLTIMASRSSDYCRPFRHLYPRGKSISHSVTVVPMSALIWVNSIRGGALSADPGGSHHDRPTAASGRNPTVQAKRPRYRRLGRTVEDPCLPYLTSSIQV